jgi:hypothetical protein
MIQPNLKFLENRPSSHDLLSRPAKKRGENFDSKRL